MRYRPPTKKPCSDCPFRPNALQGWLGAGTPESFVECIVREEPLPCHQSIDYSDPQWKEKWIAGAIGNTCAGALILAANMCKLPRDPAFPRMPADRAAVFPTHQAFLAYHNAATVKSWLFDLRKTDSSPAPKPTSSPRGLPRKPRSRRSGGKTT